MNCRFCKTTLTQEWVDLMNAPASNSYLSVQQLDEPEVYYPLKVMVCDNCRLVQVDEYKKSSDIFDGEYAYFSSYSTSWLKHSKSYTDMMIERFGYTSTDLVVEIASNDGYLLQYFQEKDIPVLGIEPTNNTASVAQEKGIETIVDFFGVELAKKLNGQGKKAQLLLGNNVLAHVPDINDFVGGLKIMLADDGVITMEFPHLYQLVENNQFDTIYHEHFSYLSFHTVSKIFAKQGLTMFDVEEIPTHGGSIRIFAKHQSDNSKSIAANVEALLAKEHAAGIDSDKYYTGFQQKVENIKITVLDFLIDQKKKGTSVAAYGAAAKGNTLLNYCGIKKDLIDYVVDANPHKQNKLMPASHIPIVDESWIKKTKPKYIIILPWNIKEEIMSQLSYIREWDGRFVTFIPELKIS